VRKTLAVLCHAAILAEAFRQSDCVAYFLVAGVGPALLLDRHLLRVLRWPDPVRHGRELAGLLLYALAGFLGAYFCRLGAVPLVEALSFGAGLAMLVVVLDSVVGFLARLAGWSASPRLIAPVLLLGLSPLVALHPPRTVPTRTPAAQGLAYEDVTFTTGDGVELRGWFVPHSQARANVVFCHGHGRNRGHAGGLLPTLHEMGLNVLAFDFRGHGESGGHAATFGDREKQDLLAATEWLRRRCPGRPLFVVGVSYGAAVTLQTIPELPDLKGVWVEGAFARLDNVVNNYFRPAPPWLRARLAATYEALGWVDCGLWGPNVSPVGSVAGASVPVCFVHARHDELVPFAEAVALNDAYPGPKTCWWVEARHYDVRGKHRDEYLTRLREFLDRCLTAGPCSTPGS
jgi:pimeloyl-ACP methyl ester carboxylesterase